MAEQGQWSTLPTAPSITFLTDQLQGSRCALRVVCVTESTRRERPGQRETEAEAERKVHWASAMLNFCVSWSHTQV